MGRSHPLGQEAALNRLSLWVGPVRPTLSYQAWPTCCGSALATFFATERTIRSLGGFFEDFESASRTNASAFITVGFF
jgi:hypothetical protein